MSLRQGLKPEEGRMTSQWQCQEVGPKPTLRAANHDVAALSTFQNSHSLGLAQCPRLTALGVWLHRPGDLHVQLFPVYVQGPGKRFPSSLPRPLQKPGAVKSRARGSCSNFPAGVLTHSMNTTDAGAPSLRRATGGMLRKQKD